MDRITPFPLSLVSQIDAQTLRDLWRIQTVPSHTPQGHWLVTQPDSWKGLRQTAGRSCEGTGQTGAPRSLYGERRLRAGQGMPAVHGTWQQPVWHPCDRFPLPAPAPSHRRDHAKHNPINSIQMWFGRLKNSS